MSRRLSMFKKSPFLITFLSVMARICLISNSAASVESLPECSDLLCSLKTIFENLKNVGKNPSPLLMGNLKI
jgi:hypothetical protein